jgi:hypothetical protein
MQITRKKLEVERNEGLHMKEEDGRNGNKSSCENKNINDS